MKSRSQNHLFQKALIGLGFCLAALFILMPQVALAQTDILNYELEFGKLDGYFHKPQGVAVDQQGYTYVTDYEDHRIQVFDPAGNFVRKWGWFGSDTGDLLQPMGIAVNDQLNRVYVAEMGGERIQVFDKNGAYLFAFGSSGPGAGQFSDVHDLAIGKKTIYVADTWNHRIQVFGHDGNYLGEWGSQGNGPGQFETPKAIAVYRDVVYVADTGNNRVQAFAPVGFYLWEFGSAGTGKGELSAPAGIDVNQNGIYVTESGNHRMQRFDLAGVYQNVISAQGNAPGLFNTPMGIALNPASQQTQFLVADADNHRVQRMDELGNVLQILGSFQAPAGHLTQPMGIAYSGKEGVLAVADYGNSRVQLFDVEGNFLNGWALGAPPIDVAIDSADDHLWIITDNGTVHRYTLYGAFLTAWTPPFGQNPGQIGSPKGLTVDGNQIVYIANQWFNGAYNTNGRIHVADAAGNHLATWGATGLSTGSPPPPDTFELPADLHADKWSKSLYVAVEGQARTKLIRPDSSMGIDSVVEHYAGMSRRPYALAVGPEDFLFVADSVGRLSLFEPFNTLVHQQDRTTGGGPGEFRHIGDMEFAEENGEHPSVLIFSGRENHRIQVFTIDGF